MLLNQQHPTPPSEQGLGATFHATSEPHLAYVRWREKVLPDSWAPAAWSDFGAVAGRKVAGTSWVGWAWDDAGRANDQVRRATNITDFTKCGYGVIAEGCDVFGGKSENSEGHGLRA